MYNYNDSMSWPNMISSTQYISDTLMMQNDVLELVGKVMMIDMDMLFSYGSLAEKVLTEMATQDIMT